MRSCQYDAYGAFSAVEMVVLLWLNRPDLPKPGALVTRLQYRENRHPFSLHSSPGPEIVADSRASRIGGAPSMLDRRM